MRDLLACGFLEKLGDGRSTRYVATAAAKAALGALPSAAPTPVGYDSGFVGNYIPNQSSLLPPQLAADLFNAGRSRDQQPAGTYAREVLEQLLIDLSWSSSRLEGNNKSLLDTKALFELGEQAGALDEDTLMLLNHKDAIEFMVDAVPTEGITVPVIVDLQARLMRDLLKDSRDIGSMRRRPHGGGGVLPLGQLGLPAALCRWQQAHESSERQPAAHAVQLRAPVLP